MTIRLFILLCSIGEVALGQVIPTNSIYPWSNVGCTPITRTSLIDVTQNPYNADNTGNSDTTSAINSAISAATTNQVVYLPNGYYLVTGTISLNKNGVTLRGNTNSIIILSGNGYIFVGYSWNNSAYGVSDNITNGLYAGQTSFQTSQNPPLYIEVGDSVDIYGTQISVPSFPVFDPAGSLVGISQDEVITSISGNTVTVSDPFIFTVTNNASLVAGWYGNGSPTIGAVGMENLTVTQSNPITGTFGTAGVAVNCSLLRYSWITNCTFTWGNGYVVQLFNSCHCLFSYNTVRYAQGVGLNHSGLKLQTDGNCLFQNSIFADGLQPGIELTPGVCGNAFIGNFFTNNAAMDIDAHNAHPMINLFEENVCADYIVMDGFFGSQSHETFLRNLIGNAYQPIVFQRWSSHMNVVGNVIGTTNSNYAYYTGYPSNTASMIFQLGYPAYNNEYYGVSPTNYVWDYPKSGGNDGSAGVYPSPIGLCISNQVNTTNLAGNFTNINATVMYYMPGGGGGTIAYNLAFMDPSGTNLLYPTNGYIIYPYSAGTISNLLLSEAVTVSAGDQVFLSGKYAFQQLYTDANSTHTITANWDYYHNAVYYDTNGVVPITNSLFTSTAPTWWGTNRWPAVDPLSSPLVTSIPAEQRYLGVYSGTTNNSTIISIPAGILTY